MEASILTEGTTAGKGMFDQHESVLKERMDPDSGLLDKLLGNKTFSRIECEDIKDHHPFYRRNVRLFHYIREKYKYDSFIGALKDTRQTHLANYLISNGEYKSEYGGDWPLTEEQISVLDTNQESLVDLVDCSELLPRLYSAQVINRRQRDTISSEPTDHKKNEVLLDILRRRSVDDYRQVVRCLCESNQSHIAEILDKGGVVVRVHAGLGNDIEANRTENDIITRFKDILSGKPLEEASRIMKDIELTIIAAKKGNSVILYVHCRTATELTVLYQMNLSEKLRDTVKQLFKELLFAFSTSEYAAMTVDNLKDDGACVLAQELYRSQMERLTVTLKKEEYEKCRSYFSDESSKLIIRAVRNFDGRKTGRREYDELMNTVPLAKMIVDPFSMVLNFKTGDYMMTTAPKDIGDQSVWWKVKHLGDGRIGYIPRNHVVIDYSQELRTTSRNVDLSKRPTTSRTTAALSTTTINFLPLELLDTILRKSYLHYTLKRAHFKDESGRCLVTRLATVDHCWSQRLRKRRFKRIIWRSLSIAFNKIHPVAFILRSNQSFLMETLRLRIGHIDQLRLCDCLTDVQSRILNRQTVTSGKRKLIGRNSSSDLFHVLRSCDDTRRSDCFRCLRHSGQKLVAKLMDNGGVAIKVKLCGRDAANLQQLSERLNDLHDKTKLRSDTQERTTKQLSDSGIEILHSQMDRQAVLCFWCKSEKGHENILSLCESKSIVDVIGDLTKNTSSAAKPIGSRMIDVDFNQLKRTTIVSPIVDRFNVPLYVSENEAVRGVTMLRQEICVLCVTDCSSPPAIRVFQNRNPFHLNANIYIGLVRAADDIGSSDNENCFLVLDSKQGCIWNIARQTGDQHKIVIFHLRPIEFFIFQWPSTTCRPTLSVFCDGHEILIISFHSLELFRELGEERTVLKPVNLPSDIVDLRHAVETSSGHFIILHSLENNDAETAEMKRMSVVSKVTRDGLLVVRRFIPQNKTQLLMYSGYLALDSDDRVFVADAKSGRVILLDSHLRWIKIICSTEDEDHSIRTPHRMCYDKVLKQLIVAGCFRGEGVKVYSFDREEDFKVME